MNILKIIFIILAFVLMCRYQIPPLVRSTQWKDLAIFLALTVLALGLTLVHVMGLDLPNPNAPVYVLVENILGYLGQF